MSTVTASEVFPELEHRQRQASRSAVELAGVPRRYPLALAQQGIWFINQLDPLSAAYNMSVVNHYNEALDTVAMWRAIREVVQRHESLRTVFPVVDGVAVQEVLPDPPSDERFMDLSQLPPSERDRRWRSHVRETAVQPFDLSTGPLFRAVLFKMTEQHFVLLLNMHHIVSDGWSVDILRRELDLMYRAYAGGERDSPLPPLERQYGDYALWQRAWLTSEVVQPQIEFWKSQLEDVADAVLPTDYPRQPLLRHEAGEVECTLSVELSARIMRLGRRIRATPFMMFLAAFEVALARYLGVRNFAIGTPVAMRDRLEVQNLVGCFINTLVLRSDVAVGLSFRELVTRVRERLLSAYDHKELPFETLVEQLVTARDLGRMPLFQAMFVFQAPLAAVGGQEQQHAGVDIGTHLAKFDLMMTVGMMGEAYRVRIGYSLALYSQARMRCLLEYVQRVVEAAAEDADRSVWRALLPDHERQRLLEWSTGRQAGARLPDDRRDGEWARLTMPWLDAPPQLEGMQVFVLDSQMEQAPTGTYGELYLGGEQISHGQLSGPRLTGARFVPNPFGRRGERIFRTGERAKWREDGQLEMAGLAAVEVTLHGQRVSLVEIERTLERYPAVTQAIVMLDEKRARGLVAYLVSASPLQQTAVRDFAFEALPNHSVPSAFVELSEDPRGRLPRELMVQQIEYWTTQLADAPRLQLPLDRGRPAQRSSAADQVAFSLDPEVTAGIRKLSQSHGITEQMALLGGWVVLLSRLSGQRDVVIGASSLPIRIQLGRLTVSELLSRVNSACLSAREHAILSLEVIAQIVDPAPASGAHPVFQVTFVWNHRDAAANCDLTLVMQEDGDRISGSLEYAIDVFERETIERHVDYYLHLLRAMLADGSQYGDRLSFLPERELVALRAWNETRADYSSRQCIHDLFAAQARRAPNAIAVIHESQCLSYGELNRQANQLAHALIERGVRPDTRVGICMERGLAMTVSILATLKAGGCYVPLDAEYPVERLNFMLADSAASLVLASRSVNELALTGAPLLLIEDRDQWQSPRVDDPIVSELTPEHLAYVIYTSGSTGQPKGVMAPHRGVVNYLEYSAKRYFSGDVHGSLVATSFSFDGTLTALFGPWLVAKTVVLLANDKADCMAQLLDYARRAEPWVFKLTPAQLGALAEMSEQPASSTPHLLVAGGEQFTRQLAEKIRSQLLPEATLVNQYGPTETVVGCCTHINRVRDAIVGEVLPIGSPIQNARLHILDDHLQPVPLGVAGELYIGGSGVVRGYLNRPGLTSERFIPDPFAAGERLYKTGDLCRRRADGQIEYLGRNDFQVKVRGYRIELGEIEACIAGYPGVWECIVLAREDQPGNKQLVAYLIGEQDVEIDLLREHVARTLPSYMRPAAFVPLPSWPLTPNSKIDRAALPAINRTAIDEQSYAAPQGWTERRVAQVFSEVLKRERVGRHDNFFELGGHSLLAVQAISRIQSAFEREFRLADLFKYTTPYQIATALLNASRVTLPPLVHIDSAGDSGLSFAQQRLWFLSHIRGGNQAYNVPTAIRLHGALDADALREAFTQMVTRHEVLRTVFRTLDDVPVQQVIPMDEYQLDWRETQLEETDTATLQTQLQAGATGVFDLTQGPLIRIRLWRMSDSHHVLLIVLHHVVTDGWSMGVFWEELWALYQASRNGQPNPLPPPALQYADYARWQRQWLTDAFLQEQLEYWRTTLAGAPQLLQLPTDHPRPAQYDFSGEVLGFELDSQTTQALRRLARSQGTTMYLTLMSGWAALLSRLSGQADVVIGTPIANRPHPALETMIGFFVNMLPIRIDLSGGVSVGQLLERVKQTFLAAHQHEHLSFGQIVEVTGQSGTLAHSPIFQVMFVWESGGATERSPASASSLEIEGVALIRERTAKYDLSLILREEGERITGVIEYATSLFERRTIQRHVEYYKRLLRALVADVNWSVDRLSFLPEEERWQLLRGWNQRSRRLLDRRYAHQMIEAQAGLAPGAVALAHGEQRLTYAELNERANRLARRLRSLGVQPEARVGLCVERGLGMVLGMLAVLKSGGAYVPLDPAYPPARLQFMLQDSAPTVLITQSHLAHLCGENRGIPIVDIDDAGSFENYATNDLGITSTGLRPHHLAYLIYTSGSTGTPKGVMLEHANLTNFLCWGQEAFSAELLSRTLASTSLSFDLAVFECLLPLTVGGTVHIAADILALAQNQEPVRLINTVPSALEALLDTASLPSTVENVNLAGEPLKASLVSRIFAGSQATAVCNLYGPTETTTYSTWTRVTRDAGFDEHIGRPVSNTQIYILDCNGEPVPVGTTGELYIGGRGVARGYFNRPALTAERFLVDDFDEISGARMYRTGDLARWREDGTIEYAGRADFQVKLRGYRIELGEIEARIAGVAGVRECIVLAREDQPGRKQLVAYLVGEQIQIDLLRAHLTRTLPSYMIPAAFVELPGWPLTPNGKLDRRALPAPEQFTIDQAIYEPPQGQTEEFLAQVFAEALNVERVGRHDSFFELGGHSLLALKIISRVQATRSTIIPLRRLFESPSVAEMAAWLDQTSRTTLEANVDRRELPVGVVRLKEGEGPSPLFLIHPVGGNVFCYAELAQLLPPGQSVFGLETTLDDTEGETPGLQSIAEKYLRRIRIVQSSGPYQLGGWSLGGLIAWEISRQLRARGERVSLLTMFDSRPPRTAQEGIRVESAGARQQRVIELLRRDAAEGQRARDAQVWTLADLEAFLVKRGLVAEATRQEETARLVAVYEQNVSLTRGYEMQPAEQPILLFTARDGAPDYIRDRWQQYSGRVDYQPIAATHYTIIKGAAARQIARRLSDSLLSTQSDDA